MAKVALRFGCAKQSKNLKRYLVHTYILGKDSNKYSTKKTESLRCLEIFENWNHESDWKFDLEAIGGDS